MTYLVKPMRTPGVNELLSSIGMPAVLLVEQDCSIVPVEHPQNGLGPACEKELLFHASDEHVPDLLRPIFGMDVEPRELTEMSHSFISAGSEAGPTDGAVACFRDQQAVRSPRAAVGRVTGERSYPSRPASFAFIDCQRLEQLVIDESPVRSFPRLDMDDRDAPRIVNRRPANLYLAHHTTVVEPANRETAPDPAQIAQRGKFGSLS